MRATVSCSRALTSDAKIDYFGQAGRLRGRLLYVVAVPDKLRLDIVSPFGATVSTLTSDGHDFSLFDLRQKQFLHGPANACNLGKFTHVPMPPAALVQLLRGEAPVLVHAPSAATLNWESGEYVVRVNLAESTAPRDLEFADDVHRRQRDVLARIKAAGAVVKDTDDINEYTFSATVEYHGELKRLADHIESVPHT